MKNLRLPPVNFEGSVRSDDEYDNTTNDLNDYLLRDGGIQSEWDGGNRLHKMRELALKFATQIIESGGTITETDLRMIDVLYDKVETTRLRYK